MADVKWSQFPSVTPSNSDEVVGLHSGGNVVFSIANIVAAVRNGLANIFVPLTRTINNKALSTDITLNASDVGAYELPSGGIPATDLAQSVQDSLGDADSAYQMPSGGIPATDLAQGVQDSLGLADTAYQLPSGGIPSSDMASAVQTSLGLADTAYQKPSSGIPATDIANGVIPTVPSISTSTPNMDGTGAAGSTGEVSDAGHTHPHDSSKANETELAYVETGSTASRNYSVKEYFCWNGALYKVISPISSGASFNAGSGGNCVAVGNKGGFNSVLEFGEATALVTNHQGTGSTGFLMVPDLRQFRYLMVSLDFINGSVQNSVVMNMLPLELVTSGIGVQAEFYDGTTRHYFTLSYSSPTYIRILNRTNLSGNFYAYIYGIK